MSTDRFDELAPQLPVPIRGVHSATIHLREPFMELARRFAHLPGTVALMSGGTLDSARYHILGIEPWLTVKERAACLALEWGTGNVSTDLDPLAVLQGLLRRYELPTSEYALPLSAGLLGYLAYDLKDFLEELPRTSVDDLGLPRLYMVAPSILVVQDLKEGSTCVHLPVFEDEEEVQRRLARFEEALSLPMSSDNDASAHSGSFASGLTRQEYVAAVEAVRDYIARGHVYQVNMSQRFELGFGGDPFALYASLYSENPAPFFAYIQAGDHQIVSTSPERFVQLRGKAVETRPIKGTRPRGKAPEEDQRMKRELESSPKDDAELSMIVDLLRNDIGKVCSAGSVHVSEHRRVETYENVHHLVSVVRGVLDHNMGAVDLIRAMFPGGSITGCPKIRAMEIIDELEPVRRHIYSGSIGYVGFHGTMDLSIAIRTATVAGGRLLFSVGGGVVYDSNASDEYEETLHKGQTLINALARRPALQPPGARFGWCNGMLRPVGDVTVSAEDEGFAYGYGFFETIRVQGGRPLMLDAHVERFNRAWRHCFSSAPPDITWSDVIQQVVSKNGLENKTAAVKLLAAAGKPGDAVSAGTLAVTAREYVHRQAGSSRSGLHLAVYPHRRHSHLSAHKTMNYMFYRMAGKWAKEHLADEALILNADRSASETNSANLFCVVDGRICCPISEHVLPGTMEKAVCELVAHWGRPVERQRLSVEDLKNADRVFVTNSLMGVVPVARIDDTPIAEDDGLCRSLNEALLG